MSGSASKLKVIFLIGALAFCGIRRCYFRFWDPNLTVTFFDVGQGDAALIQFPYGKTMLLDGGGGWKKNTMGRRVLFPELSRLGILTIDFLLLSHPDNDHGRGFVELADLLRAKELFLHSGWNQNPKRPLLTEIETEFIKRGTKINWLQNPKIESVSGTELRLIPLNGDYHSRNDQALVAEIKFNQCRILFTADVEKGSEKEWLKMKLQPVHFLKVPHHGSRTSSSWDFLRAVHPEWAVVSVGRNNTYGHPRKEILSRYHALGTSVLRTDFHGAVRFTMTPEGQVKCENYLGDCGSSRCN